MILKKTAIRELINHLLFFEGLLCLTYILLSLSRKKIDTAELMQYLLWGFCCVIIPYIFFQGLSIIFSKKIFIPTLLLTFPLVPSDYRHNVKDYFFSIAYGFSILFVTIFLDYKFGIDFFR